jgi:superfamily II DNA or RNA helicase
VTITTYQLLTWRARKDAPPPHLRLFHEANWGLVIYDEVHLLPAPIFRETAYLQARRRLGLTATLVREDGRETDVFSLVGPKRFDLPYKELEHQGWIAAARCVEVRVPLSDVDRARYVSSSPRARTRLAATNPRKGPVLERLLARHEGAQILVLGTYLEQLAWLGQGHGFPIVTGETTHEDRDQLLFRFRSGELPVLGLSRVGNFAIDLPGASVAIQVSGTFGSRQEEAQRLGRILRPKDGTNDAVFYSLVTPRPTSRSSPSDASASSPSRATRTGSRREARGLAARGRGARDLVRDGRRPRTLRSRRRDASPDRRRRRADAPRSPAPALGFRCSCATPATARSTRSPLLRIASRRSHPCRPMRAPCSIARSAMRATAS